LTSSRRHLQCIVAAIVRKRHPPSELQDRLTAGIYAENLTVFDNSDVPYFGGFGTGFDPPDYGLDALWARIEDVLPLGLQGMLCQTPKMRQLLSDEYFHAAHQPFDPSNSNLSRLPDAHRRGVQ
jgi:hypothetical protein